MSYLDRAFTKAYARSRAVEREATGTEVERVRGWVNHLRSPVAVPVEALVAGAPAEPEHAGFATGVREPARRDEPAAELLDPTIQESGSQPVRRIDPPETVSDTTPTAWAWPAICDRLLDSPANTTLRRLAASLQAVAAEQHGATVAFSGFERGAGRTSLLLTTAHLIAEEAALRLLLIDADLGHFDLLATCRNSATEAGPSEKTPTAGATPFPLIPGWLSLLELQPAGRPQTSGSGEGQPVTLPGWRDRFDLVLIDVGPWENFDSHSLTRDAIDRVISIDRFGRTEPVGAATQKCGDLGVSLLGVVETFTPAANCDESV